MLDRRRFVIGGMAALGGVATLRQLALADDSPTYPLRRTRGGRLLIGAHVDGVPVEALLDSGAEMTVLDLAFAQRLNLEGSRTETARGSGEGVLEAGIVEGITLEAAGLRLADQTVAVLDLSDVAARLLGHPLPAILGREIFDAARLQIDIAGGTVAVVTEDTEPPGQRLPLTTEHGIETFPVRVEGHAPVQAAFDLGNGSNVLIGADYARRAGLLDGQRAVTRERGGGIGGETERAVIRLAEIEVAGRTFRDVPASIEESESANDLNVGIAVLEHFLITTDFRERSLWLLPRN